MLTDTWKILPGSDIPDALSGIHPDCSWKLENLRFLIDTILIPPGLPGIPMAVYDVESKTADIFQYDFIFHEEIKAVVDYLTANNLPVEKLQNFVRLAKEYSSLPENSVDREMILSYKTGLDAWLRLWPSES